MIEVLREIITKTHSRLAESEAEVVHTLQHVVQSKLKMVETISAEEAQQARALFGWIVEVGPQNIWCALQPVLTSPQLLSGGIKLDQLLLESGLVANPPPIDRATFSNKHSAARFMVLLMSYIFYDKFHCPQPETGVYDISNSALQKLKWLYRYWFNQLEIAEENSGLEDRFAAFDEGGQFRNTEHNASIERYTSISCAGDLLAVDILTPANTRFLFDDIADFYSTADIVSANLESTVDSKSPVGRTQSFAQPARMNTSIEMFNKFRYDAKINYFSTATNHAMDWGEQGLLATLDVLEDSGAYYSGTAASQAEQDDVLVVERNGIKVALLAYTFDLNGYKRPADKPYLVNEVRFNDVNPEPDYSLIQKQVALAKAKGAQWIIAYCHWGWEFEMYPHANTVEAAHKIIDCGVDTIIGNHPHVSQPLEFIPRPGQQDALVVYSLGDFVSYHPESRNSKLAYIIKFSIGEIAGAIRMFNLQSMPVYIINEDRGDGRFDCRIVQFLDVVKNPDNYGLTDLEKSQLPHLNERVWRGILSSVANVPAFPQSS